VGEGTEKTVTLTGCCLEPFPTDTTYSVFVYVSGETTVSSGGQLAAAVDFTADSNVFTTAPTVQDGSISETGVTLAFVAAHATGRAFAAVFVRDTAGVTAGHVRGTTGGALCRAGPVHIGDTQATISVSDCALAANTGYDAYVYIEDLRENDDGVLSDVVQFTTPVGGRRLQSSLSITSYPAVLTATTTTIELAASFDATAPSVWVAVLPTSVTTTQTAATVKAGTGAVCTATFSGAGGNAWGTVNRISCLPGLHAHEPYNIWLYAGTSDTDPNGRLAGPVVASGGSNAFAAAFKATNNADVILQASVGPDFVKPTVDLVYFQFQPVATGFAWAMVLPVEEAEGVTIDHVKTGMAPNGNPAFACLISNEALSDTNVKSMILGSDGTTDGTDDPGLGGGACIRFIHNQKESLSYCRSYRLFVAVDGGTLDSTGAVTSLDFQPKLNWVTQAPTATAPSGAVSFVCKTHTTAAVSSLVVPVGTTVTAEDVRAGNGLCASTSDLSEVIFDIDVAAGNRAVFPIPSRFWGREMTISAVGRITAGDSKLYQPCVNDDANGGTDSQCSTTVNEGDVIEIGETGGGALAGQVLLSVQDADDAIEVACDLPLSTDYELYCFAGPPPPLPFDNVNDFTCDVGDLSQAASITTCSNDIVGTPEIFGMVGETSVTVTFAAKAAGLVWIGTGTEAQLGDASNYVNNGGPLNCKLDGQNAAGGGTAQTLLTSGTHTLTLTCNNALTAGVDRVGLYLSDASGGATSGCVAGPYSFTVAQTRLSAPFALKTTMDRSNRQEVSFTFTAETQVTYQIAIFSSPLPSAAFRTFVAVDLADVSGSALEAAVTGAPGYADLPFTVAVNGDASTVLVMTFKYNGDEGLIRVFNGGNTDDATQQTAGTVTSPEVQTFDFDNVNARVWIAAPVLRSVAEGEGACSVGDTTSAAAGQTEVAVTCGAALPFGATYTAYLVVCSDAQLRSNAGSCGGLAGIVQVPVRSNAFQAASYPPTVSIDGTAATAGGHFMDGAVVAFQPLAAGTASVVVVPSTIGLHGDTGIAVALDPASMEDAAPLCYKRNVPVAAAATTVTLTGCNLQAGVFYSVYVYVAGAEGDADGTLSDPVELPSRSGVLAATVTRSSDATGGTADVAGLTDGDAATCAGTLGTNGDGSTEKNAWIKMDLGQLFMMDVVEITGPAVGFGDVDIHLLADSRAGEETTLDNCTACATGLSVGGTQQPVQTVACRGLARYLLFRRMNFGALTLCTVRVQGLGVAMERLTGPMYPAAQVATAAAEVVSFVPGGQAQRIGMSHPVDRMIFQVSAPADAGRYSMCLCSVDERSGTSTCNGEQHFSATVGTLVATAVADAGRDWVLDPVAPSSIEVTGRNLDYWKDRILITDCSARCGEANVSTAVSSPGPSLADFTTLRPLRPDFDPNVSPEVLVVNEVTNAYCIGSNIRAADNPDARVSSHQCFAKCRNSCQGANCFCEGFDVTSDTNEVDSLCLPRSECLHLCYLLGDACYGVDMHKTLPRCYLNTGDCSLADSTAPSDSYDFLQQGVRTPAPARALHAVEDDSGMSTSDVLRFAPIQFSMAGTYKVCFCSSTELAQTGAQFACATEADFTIDLGRVHVTGVSTLLTHSPKLRRQRCYTQYHGGLSCSGPHGLMAAAGMPALPSV